MSKYRDPFTLEEVMRELIKALRAYRQVDEDGTMVLVSRQACEEAADTIEALTAERDALREDAERWRWWRAQVRGERALGSARPAYFSYPSCMYMPALGDIMKGSVAQHLDAAVDAARKDAQPCIKTS